MSPEKQIIKMVKDAKKASLKLALVSTAEKNKALKKMAKAILNASSYLKEENKKDLAAGLRKQYGLTHRDAQKIVNSLLSLIKNGVRTDNAVYRRGFGTFTNEKFTTRKYRSMKTGRITTKGIKDKVEFKPSKNILKR